MQNIYYIKDTKKFFLRVFDKSILEKRILFAKKHCIHNYLKRR